MEREKKIAVLSLWVLAGFALAVLYHYAQGNYLGKGYPHSTFLFDAKDRFNDFFNLLPPTQKLDPYSRDYCVYFPFAYLFMYPFSAFLRAWPSLLMFQVCFGLFTWKFMARSFDGIRNPFTSVSILILSFLTYPFLFTLDRANPESYVFIFLALFLLSFRRGKGFWGAFWLALATGMKLYPAAFGILFLAKRRYREFFLAAGLSLVLLVLPVFLFEGGWDRSWILFRENLSNHQDIYIIGDLGLRTNSGLFGLLKLGLLNSWGGWIEDTLDNRLLLLKLYLPLALLFFGGVSWIVVFKEQIFWRQVALVTIGIILLPQLSYDYKLLHLLLPLVFFLKEETQNRRTWSRAYVGLFGMLLIPKHYWFFFGEVGVSSVLNPLLLMAFFGTIIAERFLSPASLDPSANSTSKEATEAKRYAAVPVTLELGNL